MTDFTIASFNVKNLIGANREYYRFEQYTPEEHAWKLDWMSDQLVTMNPDVIGFQEVFEQEALAEVMAETDAKGIASNAEVIPGRKSGYRRKAIFRKIAFAPYDTASLAFAPNSNDGLPGQRRPGLAVVSRFGFEGKPEIVQDLPRPVDIPFRELTGEDAGHYRLSRLSRPVLKVRVPVGRRVVTVFNCHLKSKLGEFLRPEDADFAPEADLVHYDAHGRALGALRAAVRRMAEAWVLRGLVLEALARGEPVIVLGDFNDAENAVSSEIVTGEVPFRNYAWMRRHDAQSRDERYSSDEAKLINADVEKVRLHSAEKLFVRRSLRDMVYTSAFNGIYESIDQILMSRHFHPDNPGRIGAMEYFSVFNDHLTDGSHPEAPYNKLASDHGQIMAHLHLSD